MFFSLDGIYNYCLMSEQGQIEEIEDYISEEQIQQKSILFRPRTSDSASTYIQSIKSIIAKTRQVLKCPICHKRLFRPYVLPCSHRFCLRCWQKNKDTFKIICPKCKRQTNRNQALPDKTLPTILKLFEEMLEIKQRDEEIIENQVLKRKGLVNVEQYNLKKRFKYNQLTLIQVQEQKQRQVQAKKEISIYSTRMNVNKFYHNELSVGQFQIVMDIVEGKSKESLNQPLSVTDPKKRQTSSQTSSSKARHPQQLYKDKATHRGKHSSGAKTSSHKTLKSEDQSAVSETKSVEYTRNHKESISSREEHKKTIKEGRQIQLNNNQAKAKLKRPKRLNVGREKGRRGQLLSLSYQEQISQHFKQLLSQSFNGRSASERKVSYLKLKIEKYPGDIITPKLSYNQILCPHNKKVSFIQSLLATSMGCHPSQVSLFRNLEGVMKQITPIQQIGSLFCEKNHLERTSVIGWDSIIDQLTKYDSKRANRLSKLKHQGTIYFKVALQSK